MFIDETLITCQAGKGGKGCNSFERSRNLSHPRPHGGDGGTGGSIIMRASHDVHTLLDLELKKNFEAHDGKHGSSNFKRGANGNDIVIAVPIGTVIHDHEAGLLIRDLTQDGEEVTVCLGGAGGKGNHRKAEATEGSFGEKKLLKLELKLIADVGLVGAPNAGKSTLINRLSNAHSRIAAFPFTTKEPILGVLRHDERSIVIADIPGLIEGAHSGKGMGTKFLRHIERTRIIFHLVDMAGVDGRKPWDDYRMVEEELKEYSPELVKKVHIVVANKMDIPEAQTNLVQFKKKIKKRVIGLSAATGQGLDELVRALLAELNALDKDA